MHLTRAKKMLRMVTTVGPSMCLVLKQLYIHFLRNYKLFFKFNSIIEQNRSRWLSLLRLSTTKKLQDITENMKIVQ